MPGISFSMKQQSSCQLAKGFVRVKKFFLSTLLHPGRQWTQQTATLNYLERKLRLEHELKAKQLALEEQKLAFDREKFLAEAQQREAQIAIWKNISDSQNAQTSLLVELIKEMRK